MSGGLIQSIGRFEDGDEGGGLPWLGGPRGVVTGLLLTLGAAVLLALSVVVMFAIGEHIVSKLIGGFMLIVVAAVTAVLAPAAPRRPLRGLPAPDRKSRPRQAAERLHRADGERAPRAGRTPPHRRHADRVPAPAGSRSTERDGPPAARAHAARRLHAVTAGEGTARSQRRVAGRPARRSAPSYAVSACATPIRATSGSPAPTSPTLTSSARASRAPTSRARAWKARSSRPRLSPGGSRPAARFGLRGDAAWGNLPVLKHLSAAGPGFAHGRRRGR